MKTETDFCFSNNNWKKKVEKKTKAKRNANFILIIQKHQFYKRQDYRRQKMNVRFIENAWLHSMCQLVERLSPHPRTTKVF